LDPRSFSVEERLRDGTPLTIRSVRSKRPRSDARSVRKALARGDLPAPLRPEEGSQRGRADKTDRNRLRARSGAGRDDRRRAAGVRDRRRPVHSHGRNGTCRGSRIHRGGRYRGQGIASRAPASCRHRARPWNCALRSRSARRKSADAGGARAQRIAHRAAPRGSVVHVDLAL
jgi:hypothetical protein